MSRFNLLDEKWIPVRFRDGRRDELGVKNVLLHSRKIAAIEDPSPLVMASLHRFLLALLYRALEGPTDIDQAKALFSAGLPDERIKRYLDKWKERFWLFDEKYPFYQVPDYEPKEKKGQQQWKPWTAIAAEHNADNAKVLFDHVDNRDAGGIPSGKAARWLMACQTFALGGGKSDFQYTKSGPSATALMALPLGRTLHDTLILSLVPENREVLEADLPVWERVPDALMDLQRGEERAPRGWVDLYSWRSRSIKLRLKEQGEGVEELALASGIGCLSGHLVDDPMLAYRIDEKRGRLPRQFSERGLWRDFDSFLPDSSHLGPRGIEHAAVLTRSNHERYPRSIIVLGQANKKAKVEFWRMERFVFPPALAGDRAIRTEIRQLLLDAEGAQRSLWTACSSFARDLLARGTRKLPAEDVGKFVKQMSAIPSYWSTLESRFHNILGITLELDSEQMRLRWLVSVRDALGQAWEQHRLSVSTGDAWTIRALVKAERPVLRKLKQLSEEIVSLSPQMEGE